MKKKYYVLILIFVLLVGILMFFVFSKKKAEFEVDISKIELNIEIERFDKEIKAVTYHQLKIEKTKEKMLKTTILFDI